MAGNIYPLTFEHVYKDYIWGGDRIIRHFNRTEPEGIYAESWEVSTRAEGQSVVNNGALKGQPLAKLTADMGPELLGTNVKGTHFPLLIKLLDARDRLSVQVHPNDESAKAHGGEAKTEMWYVLDCEPTATIFAGLKDGMTPDRIEDAVKGSAFQELVNAVHVDKGDAIYIPGGLVHAIGEGCLLLEVQQNSDTTYRIYDWERVDADGKARPLHIAQAQKVIQWDADDGCKVEQKRIKKAGVNELWEVLTTPYFKIERIHNGEWQSFKNDGSTFHVLFIASGGVKIEWGSEEEDYQPGTTLFMPAALSEYAIEPLLAKTEILRVTVPAPAP